MLQRASQQCARPALGWQHPGPGQGHLSDRPGRRGAPPARAACAANISQQSTLRSPTASTRVSGQARGPPARPSAAASAWLARCSSRIPGSGRSVAPPQGVPGAPARSSRSPRRPARELCLQQPPPLRPRVASRSPSRGTPSDASYQQSPPRCCGPRLRSPTGTQLTGPKSSYKNSGKNILAVCFAEERPHPFRRLFRDCNAASKLAGGRAFVMPIKRLTLCLTAVRSNSTGFTSGE